MEICDMCDRTCTNTTYGGDGWSRCCDCFSSYMDSWTFCKVCRFRTTEGDEDEDEDTD